MLTRCMIMVAALSVAALLNTNAAAASSPEHDHAHSHEKPAQLTLDNGKKWSTDGNLRQGMDRIRDTLAAALPAIHSGKATVEQYRALAQEANDQIAFIAKNCKMEQEMDAMLHLVLAEIIAGAEAMSAQDSGKAREGAERIARALDNYGVYFDHPGWRAVKPRH